MQRRYGIILVAAFSAVAAAGAGPDSARATAATPPPPRTTAAGGFVTLFNGNDLSGWHGVATMDPRKFEAMSAEEKAKALEKGAEDMKKHWRVENGVIVNDGQGAYLTTDKDYGDVELKVDFQLGPKGDSGVYLRGTPQVQIWDYTEPSYRRHDAQKGSGGLWNNSPGAPGKDPIVLADKPVGEWNSLRILQVGERTSVYLNDKLVVNLARWENYWDRKLPLPKRGPIQLQTHDHEIHWRNIAVREIAPDEANKLLAEHDAKGFRPIFNGDNLAQWVRPDRELRGGRRRDPLQAAQGGRDLLQRGAQGLHRPAGVPPAPGR